MPPDRVQRAERYADRRAGRVSFAFADECKRLVGDHRFRKHSSASVVKLMLLVAYLRQGNVGNRELKGSERRTLGPMVKSSDNGARRPDLRRGRPGRAGRSSRRMPG